jgi:8-oxo-dGTP diphosphatase
MIKVTVDVALFSRHARGPELLLVRRKNDPFKDHWALPGGFVEDDEDLAPAAARELEEETGLTLPDGVELEQLQAYGTPGRDPRGRTVSVAFIAFADELPEPTGSDDAAEARWWPVGRLLTDEGPSFAFDHRQIVADAIARVGSSGRL